VSNDRTPPGRPGRELLNGRGNAPLKRRPNAYLMLPKLIAQTTIRSSTVATRVTPPVYTTFGFWLLVIGILLIGLSSIGIEAPVVELFELGVGMCFASFLIR